MVKHKRKRILPDKIFAKLWNMASKKTDRREYVRTFSLTTSPNYINFKEKFEIEYDESVSMLNEIYEKYNMSFHDILQAADKRKAEISSTFCIPIRTIEEWDSGRNRCPSYIRLMLLRHYHLMNLGKYIYTEHEEEYKATKPRVYKIK